MSREIEKMVAVGLVWGSTNALIRRGALLWDKHLKNRGFSSAYSLEYLFTLISFWQYSAPFIVNLSASATFFALLSDAPLSLAVPVTNATTFAATAVFGILLGEKTQLGLASLGTALIVIGIWLCIT